MLTSKFQRFVYLTRLFKNVSKTPPICTAVKQPFAADMTGVRVSLVDAFVYGCHLTETTSMA
jgi:hypothetical protein